MVRKTEETTFNICSDVFHFSSRVKSHLPVVMLTNSVFLLSTLHILKQYIYCYMGWAREKLDYFDKFIMPVYHEIGRHSICQNVLQE